MTTRFCTKCRGEKPLDLFAPHKRGFKGRQSRCRACRSVIDKEHYVKNREKVIIRVIKYAKDHPEWTGARRSKYKKNNPDIQNAYHSHRRANKLNATPKWLDKDQRDLIKWFYGVANSLTKITEKKYEVDHIHPLCGKGLNGLHVPWNLQVMLASENHIKSNKVAL